MMASGARERWGRRCRTWSCACSTNWARPRAAGRRGGGGGGGRRGLDELGAPVADGAAGEVWVRGPNVCAGYWKREAETAAAFRNGWFRTGDLGARSSDGYLTLRGRVSDLIISGGFNVHPRGVEELLLAQPGVREAVVIGATDPVRGEVPVAYLVSDVPLDERALREGLGAVLASFKLPRGYVRVDALPRTALGKVQKHL